MAHLTVLGASGFIGSHLVAELKEQGHAVYTPGRGEPLTDKALGTVFYCIGLTADFRTRPYETVEAHVCHLRQVLEHGRFERLVYLSSTRLYQGSSEAREDTAVCFDPTQPDHLYNMSKALGESLALHCGRPTCVVRCSNVYGGDWASSNFLPSIIKDALRDRVVALRTNPASSKDYVSIADLIEVLIHIGLGGTQRIYNVASGHNVRHGELLSRLRALCGCEVRTVADAPTLTFPRIAIGRVEREFGFCPRHLLDVLPDLVADYRRHWGKWN